MLRASFFYFTPMAGKNNAPSMTQSHAWWKFSAPILHPDTFCCMVHDFFAAWCKFRAKI